MKSNCQKLKIAPGNLNFSYHHPRTTAQFKLGKVMLPSKPWKARFITSFFFSVPAIILNTGITLFLITIIKIVIKIIVIKHLLKISQTRKCANSANYYFPYLSLSAQRTPRNVFMWIHPQCYLPVFNQGRRFGKVDFGRYREFLVSFGVVADLKCRVGCWRNFRLTIFQKVLLQLKNSFKTRFVSDTMAAEPAFVGFS